MITDAQTRLSDQQTLTTGTVVSTNSYDVGLALGGAGRDVGRGSPLRVVVTVDVALTLGTSLQANVIESASADLSTPTVIAGGPVVPEASLGIGAKVLDVVLPQTTKRYLGIQYVNAGTHSTGKVSANIVIDSDSVTRFPANTGF